MPRPLTSTEVCDLLDISPKTLYLWERAGKVPKATRDRRGWRRYSAKQIEAIRRFARPLPATGTTRTAKPEKKTLPSLTARNQIRGIVDSISSEGLLCEVVVRLADGQEIVSVVTRSAVRRLGLRRGDDVAAVIKATEVMLLK